MRIAIPLVSSMLAFWVGRTDVGLYSSECHVFVKSSFREADCLLLSLNPDVIGCH